MGGLRTLPTSIGPQKRLDGRGYSPPINAWVASETLFPFLRTLFLLQRRQPRAVRNFWSVLSSHLCTHIAAQTAPKYAPNECPMSVIFSSPARSRHSTSDPTRRDSASYTRFGMSSRFARTRNGTRAERLMLSQSTAYTDVPRVPAHRASAGNVWKRTPRPAP